MIGLSQPLALVSSNSSAQDNRSLAKNVPLATKKAALHVSDRESAEPSEIN